MARCVGCGREVDVEWDNIGYFINSDGDFACSKGCERSHRAECLRAADLPYDKDDLLYRPKLNGYDP